MNPFKSTILILPGLGNSGAGHWQTEWEKQFGFTRIEQTDWETPSRIDWTDRIEEAVTALDSSNIILVGHSLACSTIGYWSSGTLHKIKGALLVAPSDTEASSYPAGTHGFAPMPTTKLPFPSIVIMSTNDFYVSTKRAEEFATNWGSKVISIGEAGHINVAAGFGPWPDGLKFLHELDQQAD